MAFIPECTPLCLQLDLYCRNWLIQFWRSGKPSINPLQAGDLGEISSSSKVWEPVSLRSKIGEDEYLCSEKVSLPFYHIYSPWVLHRLICLLVWMMVDLYSASESNPSLTLLSWLSELLPNVSIFDKTYFSQWKHCSPHLIFMLLFQSIHSLD